MKPLIDADSAAHLAFWASFACWGVLEWRSVWREGRSGGSDRDRGTRWMLVASLLLGLWLGFSAASSLPAQLPVARWALFTVGLALMWAGMGLRWWAIRTLGRFFRREVVIQEGHHVVRDGPYRILRHPSYAGGLMTAAGVGVALGSAGSIAACLLLPLAGYLWRIRVEERALAEALGAPYRDYMRRTWRLVPFVW